MQQLVDTVGFPNVGKFIIPNLVVKLLTRVALDMFFSVMAVYPAISSLHIL